MLNSIEPPWYVTRMPGGVTGKTREGLPTVNLQSEMNDDPLYRDPEYSLDEYIQS